MVWSKRLARCTDVQSWAKTDCDGMVIFKGWEFETVLIYMYSYTINLLPDTHVCSKLQTGGSAETGENCSEKVKSQQSQLTLHYRCGIAPKDEFWPKHCGSNTKTDQHGRVELLGELIDRLQCVLIVFSLRLHYRGLLLNLLTPETWFNSCQNIGNSTLMLVREGVRFH